VVCLDITDYQRDIELSSDFAVRLLSPVSARFAGDRECSVNFRFRDDVATNRDTVRVGWSVNLYDHNILGVDGFMFWVG
jgi:hypothetical protein